MSNTISVRFYPPRIDDEALDSLRSLALTLADRAPRFTTWLVEFCDEETRRRIRAAIDDLRECDLPQIDIAEWSNADIGEAVVAVTILSMSLSDASVGEFLDRLCMFFGRYAAHRLGAYDRLQASCRGLLSTVETRRRLGIPIMLSPLS